MHVYGARNNTWGGENLAAAVIVFVAATIGVCVVLIAAAQCAHICGGVTVDGEEGPALSTNLGNVSLRQCDT